MRAVRSDDVRRPAGPVVTATVEASPTGSFMFFGPPGYYEVTVEPPRPRGDPRRVRRPGAGDRPRSASGRVPTFPPAPGPAVPEPARVPAPQRDDQPRRGVLPDPDRPWQLLRLRSVVTIEVHTDSAPADAGGRSLPGANVMIAPRRQPDRHRRSPTSTGRVTRDRRRRPAARPVQGPGRERRLLPAHRARQHPRAAAARSRPGAAAAGRRPHHGQVVGEQHRGRRAARARRGRRHRRLRRARSRRRRGATVLAPPPPPTPTRPSRAAGPPPRRRRPLVADYSFTGLGTGNHHLPYTYNNAAGTTPTCRPPTSPSPCSARPPPPRRRPSTQPEPRPRRSRRALDDPSADQVHARRPGLRGVPGPPAHAHGLRPGRVPTDVHRPLRRPAAGATDYRVS